ncbi:MAG: discoidin domain-containing protein [Candidatus Omnitrophota bacterium]|nr:MAG: discoidin domain-containing protein [Candidatus Omnitrophota bacterium]
MIGCKTLFDGLNRKSGAALILTFIVLVGLTLVAFAFATMINYEIRGTGVGMRNMQAFYIAEAGRAKARWALTEGGESVGWGESDISFGEGTYTVTTVDNGDGTYTITSEGYIPDDINPIARRRVIERNVSIVEINLSLGATATASSTQGVFIAARAIDGNSLTNWKSSVNNGSWLKLNFGSPATFNKLVIDGALINSYVIEYSTNDITYLPVTGLVQSPPWTFTFNPVSAQYLRLSVNGNRPEVDELEAYNTDNILLGQGTFVTSW